MASSFKDSPEFQSLLDGECRPSLARIALEIARDAYPDLNMDLYLDAIEELAERVEERCEPDAGARKILGQISWALFVEEGYAGHRDNYFDPRNSYLNEVMDRKKGIPISLSVLYGSIAERLGLELHGVNLPAHFMLRMDVPSGPLFIDSFHSGEILDRRGCEQRIARLTGCTDGLSEADVQPCSARVVVARMLRNLKAIYLAANDYLSAAPVQRRLAAVANDDPVEQRDLGMICLQIDRPGEAIDPLKAYLAAAPQADDANAVADLLNSAERLIARWN